MSNFVEIFYLKCQHLKQSQGKVNYKKVVEA
jgi:hypothetical protein